MNIDEKDLYWANELNKHDHKRFEVEVINTIKEMLYRHLGNNFWNLKPTFQAYVLREGGKRALIDLTFDDLNIGLEVDEGHHHSQKEADKKREADIFEAMAAVGRTNFQIFRVDVTSGFEKKRIDIESFVYAVREKVKDAHLNKLPIKWDDTPGVLKYKSGDTLRFKDMFHFYTKSDLFNTLLQTPKWGKAKPGENSVVESLYAKYNIANQLTKCPLQHTNPKKELAKLYPNQKFFVRDDKRWNWKDANRVWCNDYAPDFSKVYMKTNEKNWDAERGDKNEIQHLFLSHKNEIMYAGTYKFIGIEKIDETKTEPKKNGKSVHFTTQLVFERISDKLKIA